MVTMSTDVHSSPNSSSRGKIRLSISPADLESQLSASCLDVGYDVHLADWMPSELRINPLIPPWMGHLVLPLNPTFSSVNCA